MPLALKIVMCPWHLEMFTQFAHPVSRVSSHTVFLTADLPIALGVSWATSLFTRHLSPPGMVKNFLLRKKGSFADGWLLTFVPFGNTPYQSPQASMPHGGSLGRVPPSHENTRKSLSRLYTWEHEQDRVHPEWAQTVTSPHSAAKSWALGCLPKVEHLPSLSGR